MMSWRLLVILWQLAVAELDLLESDDECVAESCSLEALQLRAAEKSDAVTEVDEGYDDGTVYSIFTYGAVATSKTPLPDLSRPSGNFLGLRCYTETLSGGAKLDDIGAIFETTLYHARMPTLALHWDKDSIYYPGEGRPDLPKQTDGHVASIELHDMSNYIDRLFRLHINHEDVSKRKPFVLGTEFAYVAWGAYEKQQMWVSKRDVTMQQLIQQKLSNWRLVAQVQQDTLEAVDNMWIIQNEQNLDCVLAFEGTHSPQELLRNLKSEPGYGYCGFTEVHGGYGDKLYWLTQVSMPKLRPHLSKCNKVMCTGHSLGGSLCEVFAACANSRRTSDPQYQLQRWKKGTPELMPRIEQKPLSRHY